MSMYQTTRSGWSEWSDWIYHPDHQQSYRQRVDSSGNTDTQWQVEYEAARNSQTPRSDAHMDQMTQQFEAVNIQSPEQGTGEEQNCRIAVHRSQSQNPLELLAEKEKGRLKKTLTRLTSEDNKATMVIIPNTDQPLHKLEECKNAHSNSADPTTSQPYLDGSGDADDQDLQAAIAQSKHYNRDPYRGGESSATATYSAYVPQEEEEEPAPAAPPGNSEHIYGTGGETEQLDPRYRVEKSNSFQPGEVFKVLWPEPAGGGGSIVDETVYKDQYGGKIFVHFRRFIVVANDLGHCTCIPISTYGRKGCKKSGVKAEQHGIVAESSNQNPSPLHNEPTLGFPPVRVHIYEPGERISPESRVNYAKLTTVEHNVKVLFIGRVVNSDYDIVTHAVNSSWAKKMHTNKKKHRR
ncbi:hypothetical protein FGRMN_6084 [Fusarium graminum]|nr:hypothetical protein FGRMN_6084 [Fusarium graminum]